LLLFYYVASFGVKAEPEPLPVIKRNGLHASVLILEIPMFPDFMSQAELWLDDVMPFWYAVCWLVKITSIGNSVILI
jgi:hypothetical protein